MSIIEAIDLTKKYGPNRGIFNLNLSVEEGEVFGFLGPNGAGKSTTIRHFMGFSRPTKGSCTIFQKDAYHDAASIHYELGYLPGELAFMENMTGTAMLQFMTRMKGMSDEKRRHALIDRFELNPRGAIRKMSKGTKQKLGLVIAFMADTSLYVLDEPTSGLDPLMQNRFIQLVREEKARGKTIFMSSHQFEEVERTCDRTAIIRQGQLMTVSSIEDIRNQRHRYYTLTFQTPEDAAAFMPDGFDVKERHGQTVTLIVNTDLKRFLYLVSQAPVTDITMETETLETAFFHYYGDEVTS